MQKIKVALLGNPNAGKTTLFNFITGLNQKTGNYSGVTVDKSSGFHRHEGVEYETIDFPGTYSIYPSSKDEQVVFNVLQDVQNPDFPDKVIVVIDANNLKRGLLLFEQLRELDLEVIIALNFLDAAKKNGIEIDIEKLAKNFNCLVAAIDSKKQEGINELFDAVKNSRKQKSDSFSVPIDKLEVIEKVKETFGIKNNYTAWGYLANTNLGFLTPDQKGKLTEIKNLFNITSKRLQVKETLDRYSFIESRLKGVVFLSQENKVSFTEKFDKIATHSFFGYALFLFILFGTFQLIYSWSSVPMDFIDASFSQLAFGLKQTIPTGLIRDLITDGIVPGIGGVVIFIPQIAILFAFLYFLEESGYMTRVIYLLDRWLRPFGMSGKSVLPLTLGVACAVPAILSTRNIQNNKDRLITILVTPFITCSARLPVYTILIAIIIPNQSFYGINLQGVSFLFMYFLGFLSALFLGFLLQLFLKTEFENNLIMEMPEYRMPSLKGVLLMVWLKTKEFVTEAGKIILAVSILIWVLSNNSPTTTKTEIAQKIEVENPNIEVAELENQTNGLYLEKSYLGILGKSIEPVIAPLGYDWKIGIGIISSLVAREVFIGTMATIYGIKDGSDGSDTLKQKMQKQINHRTNQPTYTFATGWSLLVFYAFSMQCASTLAVVKRETKSWRWPILQFTFMTLLAYLSSFLVYSILK